MAKNRIVYGCVLLAAGLFFLFYRGHVSQFLFYIALLLPLFSLFLALPTCFGLWQKIAFSSSSCQKGEEVSLQLQVRNPFLFPCPMVRIRMYYQNQLGGRTSPLQKEEFRFALGPFRTVHLQRKVSSDFAGRITARIRRVRVCDFLGIFSLPVWHRKRSKWEGELYILPNQAISSPSLSRAIQEDAEPIAYSTVRPGDDPTEIFQLREYQEGDSLRRIHWKLSDRLDKWMVKEFSQPLDPSLWFLLEWDKQATLAEIDPLLDAFASLSSDLLANNRPHYVAWVEGEELQYQLLNEPSDLAGFFPALLTFTPGEPLQGLSVFSESPALSKPCRLIYLTNGRNKQNSLSEMVGYLLETSENLRIACLLTEPSTELAKALLDLDCQVCRVGRALSEEEEMS